MSEALYLNDGSHLPTVKVHPLVVMEILNSYIRRSDRQARVMGTLMGIIREGNVEILDCYTVPHTEKSDELYVTIMKDYHKAMYTARRHINRREVIVGWFSTTTEEGQTINDNSTLIHEFYEKECGGSSPIHLVVDTTLNGDLMGVRAFLSAPMTAGIHKFADMFHELKVDTEMSPSEVVCISQMTAGQKYVSKPWASSAVVAGIPPASQALNESIEKLLDLIDKIQEYVKGVVEGREISDPDVGMALADILGAAHSIKLQDFQTLFQSKTQDLLMTTYLTTLVQNQLAIAERLHEII